MNQNSKKYKIKYDNGRWVLPTHEKIEELALFYSQHYGIWSEKSAYSPGKRIELSAKRIISWLDNEFSEVWTVRDNEELIGYAIALKGQTETKKNVIWVTQFVIHANYRNKGVGKTLLFSIWGFSKYFAWGLVTANPYAIRALEKATRRRCEPTWIKRNHIQLMNFGKKNVCYINDSTAALLSSKLSAINTNFFVDHSELKDMLENITSLEKPWKHGLIDEGWEWFAFTFTKQSQIELSPSEIEEMLSTSDSIAKDAYNRMQMDDQLHKWSKNTNKEVDFIIKECSLKAGHKILDVGCGTGRHSIDLSKKGYDVIGIDYADTLIYSANEKAKALKLKTKFICDDITRDDLSLNDASFDCIICIYDVIGSYADNNKNIEVLKNISRLLKPGAYVIISVMNLHLTEHRAKNKFVLKKSSQKLLDLKASETMATTGNIFNPNYYLLDEETNVIYRKEIFSYNQDKFPTELIVRDRRYYLDDIVKMCENENLEIIKKRFVNAGWENDFERTDNKAKEILLVCRKKGHFKQIIHNISNILSNKKRFSANIM